MNNMKIYHNPRCRKSRESLQIIQESKIDFHIIEYLKNPISKSEIKILLKMLNISALDLIRKEEKIFKSRYKGKTLSEEDYINILYRYPILMQRPIIVKDNRAVLGRPPINILDLLNN